MRALLLTLVALFAVAALPSSSSATPCTRRCTKVARVCKQRCRMTRSHFGPRRECTKACRLRELNCKAGCP